MYYGYVICIITMYYDTYIYIYTYIYRFTNHCLFEMNIQGSSMKAKSHRSRGIGSVLPAAGGYRCLCHWKTGAAVDPAGFGH